MADITTTDIMDTLQDLMQITADGFTTLDTRMDGLDGRMDGLDGRMDGLETRMDGLDGRMDGLEGSIKSIENRLMHLERQYSELKEIVQKIAGEQKAQTNDISEILDRLLAIEKRLPNISETEIKEMQTKLQALIDWAVQSAKINNIPLKLPKS